MFLLLLCPAQKISSPVSCMRWLPQAMGQPDEAIDAGDVLDDRVATDPDRIVGKDRGRIRGGEGPPAVGRIRSPPVGGEEYAAPAARAAGLRGAADTGRDTQSIVRVE